RVMVGREPVHAHPFPGWYPDSTQLRIAHGHTAFERDGRDEAQQLLDGSWDQGGVVDELLAKVSPAAQDLQHLRPTVRRRVHTRGDKLAHHPDALVRGDRTIVDDDGEKEAYEVLLRIAWMGGSVRLDFREVLPHLDGG